MSKRIQDEERSVGAIATVNAETGEQVDSSVREGLGTMFDPNTQHMDLTKDEKRRTTALLLAIQAYDHLIIKDAEMYRAIKQDERHDGPQIQPATMNAMVNAAIQFDYFIAGGYSVVSARKDEQTSDSGAELAQEPVSGAK